MDVNNSFGQILATNNLPINASIETGWFDDTYSIKDLLFSIISDQNLDVFMYCRDKELISDTGTMLFTTMISTGYARYQSGQTPGFSFKIVVVNNSGVVANNVAVRLQTIGY